MDVGRGEKSLKVLENFPNLETRKKSGVSCFYVVTPAAWWSKGASAAKLPFGAWWAWWRISLFQCIAPYFISLELHPLFTERFLRSLGGFKCSLKSYRSNSSSRWPTQRRETQWHLSQQNHKPGTNCISWVLLSNTLKFSDKEYLARDKTPTP